MASSTLQIILKSTKTGSGGKDAERELDGLEKRAKSTSGTLKNLATAGFGALAAGIGYSVKAAMEAQRVMAQTESVIKSTGGAAGVTADEIAKLALAESRLTSIDDEVIQSGQNMLLTFTNIGGNVFPRATRAMEDMAVAMAKGDTSAIDLNGTAIQLGKALNDPLKGMTALQKVGVTFSAAQRDAIKEMMAMNDVAGAQTIILKELEKEFGGSAEAAGNTLAGKLQKAQNSIENLAESIGTRLLPVLGDAADALSLLIDGSDRIREAQIEHEAEVRKTAKSYEEYITEIVRSNRAEAEAMDLRRDVERGLITEAEASDLLAEAAGALTRAQKEVDRASREAAEAIRGQIAGFNEDGRAMWQVRDAAKDVVLSQDEIAGAMNNLKTVMSGIVGNEMTSFNAKQDELKAKAAELQVVISKSYGQAKIDAVASLAEVNAKISENAATHEDATRRILFDLAVQQLAIGGTTQIEAQALMALGVQWGLVDQATADATNKILEATGRLATDENIPAFTGAMEAAFKATGASADSATGRINGVGSAIGGLSDKTVTVTTVFEEVHRGGGGGGGVTEMQHGGPISGASPVLVGERGPEMFFPRQAGFVMNNNDTRQIIGLLQNIATGIGGAGTINVNAGAGVDANAIMNAINVGLGRRARLTRSAGATVLGT